MSLQDNGSLHNSHQPLLLFTIIHHRAHNGSLIFIMRVTYTTPRVVMYSPENITSIGGHNQTHQMFALSVVFRNKKKKWESSALAARGNGSYPITRVLYHQERICYLLGTDTERAPQIIPVNLNYIWHAAAFGLQKASPSTTHKLRLYTCALLAWISLRSRCQHRQPVTVVTFLVVYEPDSDPCVC